MNISEHLALFVKHNLRCNTIFTLTGGGAMFLNDAFGNTPGLNCIYNHHEQASAMGALGFSKVNGIGVCITTTGCGATNALTGLLDSWQDSQPVLFISGQVKKRETTYYSGLSLRSFGVQELNIIPIVESLTKKAVCIGSKKDYFECLSSIPDWLYSEDLVLFGLIYQWTSNLRYCQKRKKPSSLLQYTLFPSLVPNQ